MLKKNQGTKISLSSWRLWVNFAEEVIVYLASIDGAIFESMFFIAFSLSEFNLASSCLDSAVGWLLEAASPVVAVESKFCANKLSPLYEESVFPPGGSAIGIGLGAAFCFVLFKIH